jgi:hypothetical protein
MRGTKQSLPIAIVTRQVNFREPFDSLCIASDASSLTASILLYKKAACTLQAAFDLIFKCCLLQAK